MTDRCADAVPRAHVPTPWSHARYQADSVTSRQDKPQYRHRPLILNERCLREEDLHVLVLVLDRPLVDHLDGHQSVLVHLVRGELNVRVLPLRETDGRVPSGAWEHVGTSEG